MIKAIIIEDNIAHSKNLLKMLGLLYPEIKVVSVCDTIQGAINEITAENPDLIFLDITLQSEGDGFEVLKQTKQLLTTKELKYKVIFTTVYDQYAIQAIEFSALRYLLKTVREEKLKEAITYFKEIKSQEEELEILIENLGNGDKSKRKIRIGKYLVTIEEIIRCEAKDRYTKFYLTNNRFDLLCKTLKAVEDSLLNGYDFYRIHESHLINLQHEKKILRKGNNIFVEITGGEELPISRSRASDFLNAHKL